MASADSVSDLKIRLKNFSVLVWDYNSFVILLKEKGGKVFLLLFQLSLSIRDYDESLHVVQY